MCDELHVIRNIRENVASEYKDYKFNGDDARVDFLLNDLRDILDAYDIERQRFAAIRELFTNVVNGGFHYRYVKPLAEALGVPLLNRQQVAAHVADKRDAQTVAQLAEMAHAGE